MKSVTLDGKNYVKASVLAKELGYTTDYVGQLCRAGKVDSQLVGRNWYVCKESIHAHKSNRYRTSKVKSRKAIKEHVAGATEEPQSSHFYHHGVAGKKVNVSYDADDYDLLPPLQREIYTTQRLPVELAGAKDMEVKSPSLKYHFISPKKPEIKFHGTLIVKDIYEKERETIEPEQDSEENTSSVASESFSKTDVNKVYKPVTEDTPKTSSKKKKTILKNYDGVIGMRKQKLVISKLSSATVRVQAVGEQLEVETGSGRFLVLTSVLSAVAISFVLVGLETQVQFTEGTLTIDYVFVIQKLFALVTVAI